MIPVKRVRTLLKIRIYKKGKEKVLGANRPSWQQGCWIAKDAARRALKSKCYITDTFYRHLHIGVLPARRFLYIATNDWTRSTADRKWFVFTEGGKPGKTRKNPWTKETQITYGARFEQGPQRWQASALTARPPMRPQKYTYYIQLPKGRVIQTDTGTLFL